MERLIRNDVVPVFQILSKAPVGDPANLARSVYKTPVPVHNESQDKEPSKQGRTTHIATE